MNSKVHIRNILQNILFEKYLEDVAETLILIKFELSLSILSFIRKLCISISLDTNLSPQREDMLAFPCSQTWLISL